MLDDYTEMMLYGNKKRNYNVDFDFDALHANPMGFYLSQYDIQSLYNIASSIRFAGNIEKKYKAIDSIMRPRGFKKFIAGTNRICYSYLEDQSFLIKIAVDRVGMGDNPAEFKNQHYLKPYVCKVFEMSPCGTVGMFERVQPILNREQFYQIGDAVFNVILSIIGDHVIDDIGSQYFMNWGFRRNFGPVILDYPYLYKTDGNKLYCNKRNNFTGQFCGGLIDYDPGFNNLVCTKCGKVYKAIELKKAEEEDNALIVRKGERFMGVKVIFEDGRVIEPEKSTRFIQKPVERHEEQKSTFKCHVGILDENGVEIRRYSRAERFGNTETPNTEYVEPLTQKPEQVKCKPRIVGLNKPNNNSSSKPNKKPYQNHRVEDDTPTTYCTPRIVGLGNQEVKFENKQVKISDVLGKIKEDGPEEEIVTKETVNSELSDLIDDVRSQIRDTSMYEHPKAQKKDKKRNPDEEWGNVKKKNKPQSKYESKKTARQYLDDIEGDDMIDEY